LTTPLEEWARVYKAAHRIEQCLKLAKGEAGLGDYQVRTWEGWHHHQVLSLLTTWFLTQETRRGKKADSRVDDAAGARGDGPDVESVAGLRSVGTHPADNEPSFVAQRGGAAVPLEATQTLAAGTI
jgi:hypothetical protein